MSLVNCTRYYLSTIYRDYDIVDFVVKQSAAMIFSRELDSSTLTIKIYKHSKSPPSYNTME